MSAPLSHRRLLLLALGVVLALSLLARSWDLQRPREYMFDEVYYAKDAATILYGDVSPAAAELRWEPGDEVSWAHPEMGKFAVALGILLAGDRSVGWRLPSVAAGMVILACVYPIARRLGLSRLWAFVALVFAATDLLGIAQSRIATLDVFVALWTVLCIYLALRYADDRRARWLVLAGLAGGLAVSTKWSGLLALGAAVIVIVAKRWSHDRAAPGESAHQALHTGDEDAAQGDAPGSGAGIEVVGAGAEGLGGGRQAVLASEPGEDDDAEPAPPPPARRILRPLLLWAFCLVVLPAAIYLASYAQYFAVGHTWADFVELHRQMWHFNTTLSAPHSYASKPITWMIDKRPVWYYFNDRKGVDSGVVAMGNPFLWWTTVAALLGVPITCVWKRTRQGLLPLALVMVLYLPWLGTDRTSFIYYMAPVAPFMAILVAQWGDLALGTPGERGSPPWPALIAWLAGFALAAFAWYPLGRGAELAWSALARPLGWSAWHWTPVTAVAVVLGALMLAGGAALVLRGRGGGAAAWLAWAWTGAIAGIAIAFLPIVLADPIKSEQLYRLMWFRSWI